MERMKKTTAKEGFYQWLKKQKERQDRVGDFARDALRDNTFPKNANILRRLVRYLESQHASSAAIDTLYIAFEEYTSGTKPDAKKRLAAKKKPAKKGGRRPPQRPEQEKIRSKESKRPTQRPNQAKIKRQLPKR